MESNDPGKLIWHVACDESGIDGQRFYGFGSLWMKYQRRGDFARIVRELREKHNCSDEIKWQKAHSKRNAAFYAGFNRDLLQTPLASFSLHSRGKVEGRKIFPRWRL